MRDNPFYLVVKTLIVTGYVFMISSFGVLAQVPTINNEVCVAFCGSGSPLPNRHNSNIVGNTDTSKAALSRDLVRTGLYHANRDEHLKAIGFFRNSLQFQASNQKARKNLAISLAKYAVKIHTSRNAHARTKELLQEATNLDPSNPRIRNLVNQEKASHRFDNLKAPCSVCGRALINDLSVGLRNSSQFRSYAQQSRAKYSNCKSSVFDQCKNTCGDTLYNSTRNCSSRMVTNIKACFRIQLIGTRAACGL